MVVERSVSRPGSQKPPVGFPGRECRWCHNPALAVACGTVSLQRSPRTCPPEETVVTGSSFTFLDARERQWLQGYLAHIYGGEWGAWAEGNFVGKIFVFQIGPNWTREIMLLRSLHA